MLNWFSRGIPASHMGPSLSPCSVHPQVLADLLEKSFATGPERSLSACTAVTPTSGHRRWQAGPGNLGNLPWWLGWSLWLTSITQRATQRGANSVDPKPKRPMKTKQMFGFNILPNPFLLKITKVLILLWLSRNGTKKKKTPLISLLQVTFKFTSFKIPKCLECSRLSTNMDFYLGHLPCRSTGLIRHVATKAKKRNPWFLFLIIFVALWLFFCPYNNNFLKRELPWWCSG